MLGMVQLGIIDAQWDSNWTYTFQGAILFVAVILNMLVRSTSADSQMNAANRICSKATRLAKYYGNIVALRDISMHVDAGEVTCILGDNGAGKSSLIKILSGVHQHDDGRVARRRRRGDVHVAARRARTGASRPSTRISRWCR